MTARWTAADLPDQAGRTIVITGANSGIGLTAARALADAGARVVLAVRDEEKGRRAAETIEGHTEVRRLDLADLGSIRAFAAGWEGDLHVLINNAGIMAVPEARTADGFESQLGTNHLGPFALTGLLLEHVADRVVTLASLMHRFGRIGLDDPNFERRRYRRWVAYNQSKLANLLFTLELQRRLAAAGSPVRALAAHPGWTVTNLQSHSGSRLQHVGMAIGNRVIGQSDVQGALPTLYAATQDLAGGSYVGPGGRGELHGPPALASRSRAARDGELARRLWDLSERLTGVRY
jgi:NAD(P)-dependent dehydrogenase (short-subunit alcohol dehydrogenase family)